MTLFVSLLWQIFSYPDFLVVFWILYLIYIYEDSDVSIRLCNFSIRIPSYLIIRVFILSQLHLGEKQLCLNFSSILKENGLQNAHFSIFSVPGLICAIEIRETALYSLGGPLESNYSKEATKKEQKFLTQKHE